MSEKQRFEKWLKENEIPNHAGMWEAWQAARRWIPVEEEKIPLNEFVICGLWVDDTENDYSYFDTYYIYFDDEFEPRDKWENYLSEWSYDDFTHFKYVEPPEDV